MIPPLVRLDTLREEKKTIKLGEEEEEVVENDTILGK